MSDLPEPRRPGRLLWLVVLGIALAAAILGVTYSHKRDKTEYLTAKVLRGEIRDTVDATGTVNAVITVQVGSQVSGTIARLDVDFNSRVHKGQVIGLIDPKLLEGSLAQTEADLSDARANVIVARSNLTKARVNAVQTKLEYERSRALAKNGVGTQQALDLARANADSSEASVSAAEASVTQASAQVEQKAAAVQMARTNLDYTVIRSPIDGVVVARNVDIGQTVAASLQAPTIFTIAKDLTKMQVYAKVDESDVGRIRVGQPASFKVDAFPRDQFTGTVTQIRMNPTLAQNVVTYDAIVEFTNPDLKLFPGMTAYVTLPVATARDVVKVPNAALRFKPAFSPEEVRALYARYGVHTDADGAADGKDRGSSTTVGPRRNGRPDLAVVWKLGPDRHLFPIQVALGITDHTYTELVRLMAGALAPGDELVTTALAGKGQSPGVRR